MCGHKNAWQNERALILGTSNQKLKNRWWTKTTVTHPFPVSELRVCQLGAPGFARRGKKRISKKSLGVLDSKVYAAKKKSG